MWDDDYQTTQTRPNALAETLLLVEQSGGDGIARYLRTMHEVAHTSGMCHWCTPGHNRGKAAEALAAGRARALPTETTTLPIVRRALQMEKIHG